MICYVAEYVATYVRFVDECMKFISSTIRLNHLPCHNITKELHDGLF